MSDRNRGLPDGINTNRHCGGMNTNPDLSLLELPHDLAVSELQEITDETPRGGPAWDPFRDRPERRLSPGAQDQLIALYSAALEAEREAEERLGRARSVRARSSLSERVYRMSAIRTWAQEAVLASVSLLLVKRVNLALRRHSRRGNDHGEDYMGEALACAMDCLDSYRNEEGVFHLYVASAVDARLSKKLLEGSVAESMPQAWQVALRHVPAIEEDLAAKSGRTPSDGEVAEALLSRSRSWAQARIVEKGGEVEEDVLAELVEAKLTKQGMFSAARNIGDIRAAAAGTLSLDADVGDELACENAARGADLEVELRDSSSKLQSLLEPLPGVGEGVDGLSAGDTAEARTALQSRLWHSLVERGGLPVEQARVSRKAPDLLALVCA